MFSIIRAVSLRREGNRARDARDWQGAKANYAEFLSLWPSNAAIWVQYGHAAKEGGDLTEAESAYRRALSLNGKKSDTHLQLGHALKLQGRLEEAEEAYRHALAIAPQAAEIHLQLGHLLKTAGRWLEAEEAYNEALQRDPSLDAAQNGLHELSRKTRALKAPKNMPRHLRYINIGTTGLCNASCFSCPTGKAETAHVPRVPMPMELFEKLIRSIVELDLVVTNQISFGLFGDSLIDPYVLERAKLVRSLIPDAHLVVNTNGAAYNRARHKELFQYVSFLALHCESLETETYEKLMQPLRAARVFPKIEQILEDFHGKVLVSTPTSRLNVNQLPAIKDYFVGKGAIEVVFDPISSRCAENRETFLALALNPALIQCPSEILNDLAIDCDGTILLCCQDFQRLEPVGNLSQQTLEEVLTDPRRQLMRDRFDQGRHGEVKTCSRCYADVRSPMRESQDTGPLYQGDLARNMRDWPRARAAYGEFLQHLPARFDIWIQYGHACKEGGDLQEAEVAYRRAIAINGAHADAHLQLGHLLNITGRREEALQAYTDAVAYAVESAQRLQEELQPAAFQTAKHYEAMRESYAGNWSRAAAAYRDLLQSQPQREDLWVQYGHAAKESGYMAEAESAYRQAITLNPANADTYFHLGYVCRLGGRFEEARQAYSASLAQDPSFADAQRELAELLEPV